MRSEAKIGVMCDVSTSQSMPRIHLPKLERVKAGFFLRAITESMALPTLRFQTSS